MSDPETDLQLSRADALEFRDALTQAVQTESTLRQVLSDSGFDTARLPPGLDLRSLAGRVFDDLAHGTEPGYRALLSTVLSRNQFPKNTVFLRLARDYAPDLVAGSGTSAVAQSPAPAVRTGLGAYPVDWTRLDVQETAKILQTIYHTSEIENFVLRVGLNPAYITLNGPASVVWREVFELAAREGKVDALLDEVSRTYPGLGRALDEVRGAAPGSAGPAPQIPDKLLAQEEPWDDVTGQEAVIDESAPAFVDVVFFAQGLDRARSVCRLVPWFPGHRIGSGTGFRIGPDLILTSHHILFDWGRGDSRALSVDAWFNYEVDEQGKPRKKVEIPCDPTSVIGEREHDWAVIRTQEPIPDAFPPLPLGGAPVPEIGDRVSIIQHPQRLPKKVAFQHNLIRDVKPDRILYWTDTDEGSSGSPVFDQDWRVVALHHWTIPAPQGERSKWWNQGRRIDGLIERLKLNGIELPAR